MKKFLMILSLVCLLSPAYADEMCSSQSFYNAIKKGDIDFVKENVSKVEDINDPRCFLCAAAQYKQNEILDILLDNKADVNCPESSFAPVYSAIYYENHNALEKLLKAGADPNDKRSLTAPLYFATVSKDVVSVKHLLEAGADENVKFMGMSAVKYAFLVGNFELQQVFIDNWNKRFETPAVNLDETVKLLEPIKSGNKYYKILMGENPSKKPFIILFCDINKIAEIVNIRNTSLYANVYYSNKKQNVFYIDNSLRNYPKEVLASLLAGESINTDGKNSVIEALVTLGVAGDVWKELVIANPKINDESIPLIATFNAVNKIMNATNGNNLNAGDYNNLWAFSGLFKAFNKTSKGFRNEDLNTYFQD